MECSDALYLIILTSPRVDSVDIDINQHVWWKVYATNTDIRMHNIKNVDVSIDM